MKITPRWRNVRSNLTGPSAVAGEKEHGTGRFTMEKDERNTQSAL